MTIPAFPLQWPAGWPRIAASNRTTARFGKASRARSGGGWDYGRALTINEGVERVRAELSRMHVRDDDLVINSNLALRLDGFPKSGQREPDDPGVAVYWRDGKATRCMAIDRYDRVADNLAAIAATIEAMRSIERHGGAAILDRAFTGFVAIGHDGTHWTEVLGVQAHTPTIEVRERYRRARAAAHPDRNSGNAERFAAVQSAWSQFCQERGLDD